MVCAPAHGPPRAAAICHSFTTNQGTLYEKGHGVNQSTAKAKEWYAKAVGAPDYYSKAQLYMGMLLNNTEGKPAKAVEWYTKAAKQGEAKAMINLGFLHFQGGPGVPRDYAKAKEWYELAAKQEDCAEQENLMAHGWREGP